MKIVLILLAFMLPIFAFSQTDSIITYTEIVKVDSVAKDELYKRARAWVNVAFNDSKQVIQIQDKETGEIAGKGILFTSVDIRAFGKRRYEARYKFSFKILVKDDRYKYEFANFDNYWLASEESRPLGILTSSSVCPVKPSMVGQNKMNETWQSAKQYVDKQLTDLTASLKAAMSKGADADF